MATTTSTDLTVDEGTADAGLPLPAPQDVDGPICKQVWQTQTDALVTADEDVAEPDATAPTETADEHSGTHSA